MRRLRTLFPGEGGGPVGRKDWIPAFAGKQWWAAALLLLAIFASPLLASEGEKPVARDYSLVRASAAPETQTPEAADAKSAGCVSCHTDSDQKTMHKTQAVVLGCTDCHGGNAAIRGDAALAHDDPRYVAARDKAHVLPVYPKAWNWPSSANPKHSYALLNRESPEYIRFVNPSDYRVVRESCGACHSEAIEAAERSLMSTGAMFWAAAAYNNGVLLAKTPLLGEAYTHTGQPAKLISPFTTPDGTLTPRQKARGALAELYPLPTWQVVPPGDVFRVFEQGGRINATQFPEIGLPSPSGEIQRLDESGRPDIRQSNRGPGTGLRVAIPILNLHKTRLNDPFMWFMGTNDQPGDYRHSGCAGCHVVYANDRDPKHSLTYAQFGRDGQTATVDPTIPHNESGHPIEHGFTRAIPTSQCMDCHMHQPNIFLNSYLGYTMWDYEADADLMWPGPENRLPAPPGKEAQYRHQHYPTAAQTHEVLERNPEGAAPRGLWADVDFVRHVADDVNPLARHTQFADYHGHGWNFRAIYKRDREGNLLDAQGNIVRPDDPEKFRRTGEGQFAPPGVNPGKAVHLMDIHAEKGMQCADCHFARDSHGNGFIMAEVPDAIEIQCKDCHGTTSDYPNLLTSGPAAPPKGTNLALLRNEDGRRRFEWVTGEDGRRELIQRSVIDPKLEWRVSLVKDSVDPANPHFNLKAARAKLMSQDGAETGRYVFGAGVPQEKLAHKPSEMACFTCHLSWTTSCAGCHLPIEANWKTANHHYQGEETRNFATYNPQVAREDMFQLGRHSTVKGNIIAPVRSSSALLLSSTNLNRERIYVQQSSVSGGGFSSQAFAPHFPHTVRTTETKTCTDCHLSEKNDNNAIMAQLLLQGTNFVNFVGLHAWTGLDGGFQATRVTEWEEPQAVIGSYLQRFAYPDYWRLHVNRNKRELVDWTRGTTFDRKLSGETDKRDAFLNIAKATGGPVHCLQNRGEYMYVAEGSGGFRVYDIANIANKGVSEKIVTAPFSPLGHDAHVATKNATCMALPTNQMINPLRNTAAMRAANQEQAFHPIYNYAVITDSEEGLILVDVTTFADGNPRNNFLRRAVTWNPDGVLNGARHITLAGDYAYITAAVGLVVVDLADPLHPRLTATLPLRDARASALQFRYLWVTDADGLRLFDVTHMDAPKPIPSATVPLADARKLYVARTYAYVAGKQEGLVIVNVTNPEKPIVYRKETFGGRMSDVEDVVVGSTNASLFAYVADGRNGMKVIQLTSPESQPNFYGFSPAPFPELIAWAKTPHAALAMAKGLDRDRAVDETGGQIAVFGRIGSRPFTRAEMERLFLNRRGVPWKVQDTGSMGDWVR
jgi:hypothetical protein